MGHQHPVFARAYQALLAVGEHRRLGELRDAALTDATGRLLVVGLGPGRDLDHLPAAVREVIAVEPEATMRAAAARRVRRAGRPVWLVASVGEALPLASDSVDAVLCALVLCSVDDPVRVLAEVRRVLRPGGVLGVLEHVREGDSSRLGRLQDRSARAWAAVAGGCHPNLRTRALLAAAGFDTSAVRDVRFRAGLPLLIPHLVGTARLTT